MPGQGWLQITVIVALASCGSDPDQGDAGPADAGTDDAAQDAETPFEPAAPEPPALPVMTPCPEGWREVPDDETAPGLVRCDPWPEGGHQDCPVDQAHFPGGTACEVVGTPCSPDSPWATDLPDDQDIIYVQAGRAGGSGLEENPFGSLQHAIDVANARGGAIVALSKGTFDGAFTIYEPVTLWGACTAETILTRTDVQPTASVLEINDLGPVAVRNLRIEAEQAGIYVWEQRDQVVVDSVVIRGRYVGIILELGSTVELSNVVILDTAPGEDERNGQGIVVTDGSHAIVSRALIQGTHLAAATAQGDGSELTMRDSALLDTQVEVASGLGGAGVQARLGGQATMERVVVERAYSGGVVALDEGTVVEATDLVVRDVEPAEGYGGHGVVSWDGAAMTGRRIDVARTHQTAVTIIGDSTGEIDDLVVQDTRTVGLRAEYGDGVGIGVGLGSTGTFRRTLVSRSVDSAVAVDSEGARLVAEDLTVQDTTWEDYPTGFAVAVDGQARAEITRLHATRSSGGGVTVFGALTLTDAVVEDTRSIGVFDFDGWGLAVALGARVDATRLILRGNTAVGLTMVEAGQLVGRDVQIFDTIEEHGVGTGMLVAGPDSLVDLTSFRIAGSESCGLQIAGGAGADLRDGEVRDNPIGANVQDPDFDLTRIQEGVRYLDNGVNLDTSQLPIPELDTVP